MSTESPPLKFAVDVEGVGKFVFRRRDLNAEFAIARFIRDLTGGHPLGGPMDLYAEAVSDLFVLTAEAPEGWAPDVLLSMDPLEPEAYEKLLRTWSALRDKEESFRPKRKAPVEDGEGPRAGDVGDDRVLVPAGLQPAADGSALSGDDPG